MFLGEPCGAGLPLEPFDEAISFPERFDRLNAYLRSHLIAPEILRSDDFEAFMADRQKRLLGLIELATGKAVYAGEAQEEGIDAEADADTVEADMVISA